MPINFLSTMGFLNTFIFLSKIILIHFEITLGLVPIDSFLDASASCNVNIVYNHSMFMESEKLTMIQN